MKRLLTLLTLILPSAAFAHAGHAQTNLLTGLAGFIHPFTGVDHLLAMLAVGLWAGRGQGAVRWQMPAVFVGVMLLGFVLGTLGVNWLHLESALSTSVLILGLLLTLLRPLSLTITMPLVAAFALLHGLAHGHEASADSPVVFALGFTLSTCLLLGSGAVLGNRFKSHSAWIRSTGALIGLTGVALLLH